MALGSLGGTRVRIETRFIGPSGRKKAGSRQKRRRIPKIVSARRDNEPTERASGEPSARRDAAFHVLLIKRSKTKNKKTKRCRPRGRPSKTCVGSTTHDATSEIPGSKQEAYRNLSEELPDGIALESSSQVVTRL